MTLTSHGHHIPGTTDLDEPKYPMRHRCGGPDLCETCGRESSKARHPAGKKPRTTSLDRSLELLIQDLRRAEDAGDDISAADLRKRIEKIAHGEDACPTCSGPTRQTVNMKCPDCGTDYS